MAIVKFFLLVLFGCLVSCEKQATDFPTALDENLERAENLNARQSYREAYLYYDKSFAYNQELGYTKRMVYCLLRMAEIEKVECDYAGSEETATRAIALFDDTIPIAYQVNAYIGLGLNYTHLNNFDEGLKNYHKALQLTDDELSRCIIQNNIAYLYSKDQHFHKAISILNQIEKNETNWFSKDLIEVILEINIEAKEYFFRKGTLSNMKILEENENHIVVSTNIYFQNEIINLVKYWIPCIKIKSPKYLQEKLSEILNEYLQTT